MPYSHMLSISADDLLETSEWSRVLPVETPPVKNSTETTETVINTVHIVLLRNQSLFPDIASIGVCLYNRVYVCCT
jgi:hypothetical protein